MNSSFVLKKSGYLSYLSCINRFLIYQNHKDKIPPRNQFKNLERNELIELYFQQFPKATNFNHSTEQNTLWINDTNKQTIFFTKWKFENLETLVDGIISREDGSLDLIEIRPSLGSKDSALVGLSFSLFILEKLNIKIQDIHIITISKSPSNEWEKSSLSQFFQSNAVTKKVRDKLHSVQENIEKIFTLLGTKEVQSIEGQKCLSPKKCDFQEICFEGEDLGDVLSLREGQVRGIDLFQKGVRYIKNIPKENLNSFNRIQMIQYKSSIENKIQLQKEPIVNLLEKIIYPVYFLDFESINPIIPMFQNTKPFQHIPFLFSSLKWDESENKTLESFLYTGHEDPRKDFALRLIEVLGDSGSILCYNDLLETKTILDLAQLFPEIQIQLENLIPRIIDLFSIFRDFHYYHPSQNGHTSLKDIHNLVTLKNNYKILSIQDGQYANLCYLAYLKWGLTLEGEKKMFEDLVAYCNQDTEAIFDIYLYLKKLIQDSEHDF